MPDATPPPRPPSVYADLESDVRSYCRSWPTTFVSASGSTVTDQSGKQYLDFFAGAGALSFGHNDPQLIDAAITHLRSGGLLHSLDTHTPEKGHLLEALRDVILEPRGLDMVVQFVGPTGATSVEAALRLAHRVTGRHGVVAFDGGYHGMTERTAGVSGSLGRLASDCTLLPFVADATGDDVSLLDEAMRGATSGSRPGAVIIEPTQGEGGARPFDPRYLDAVGRLARAHDVVVIADEVQAGVGRTGGFFSFEGTGLDPDIVCLSKSISGLGLPLALNLVRRSRDQWSPGEFTGTFRGSNLAFVTATAMLHGHWRDDRLETGTARKGLLVHQGLAEVIDRAGPGAAGFEVSGKGLLWGLHTGAPAVARKIAAAAFDRGLLVETCGPGGGTVKILPPLVIEAAELERGFDCLADAAASVLRSQPRLLGAGQL